MTGLRPASVVAPGRVAVLNGFGRALGDGIVGLQALHVALARGALPPGPVLFRLPGLPVAQRQLYAAASFAEVRDLPWDHATPAAPFAPAARFARTIDLRDFAFDPAFRGVAMIDFFLARLGVDPAGVCAAEKRNTWLAPLLPARPRATPRTALLCAEASMPLRTMPSATAAAIADWLGAHGWTVRVPGAAPSLAALCETVAASAWVVSTDTAMVHLADALARPCLAFFPTHRPEWRVRDYPLCRAVHLPAPGLPEALEFARDDADLAAARRAWFPHGDDLSWLDEALAAAQP